MYQAIRKFIAKNDAARTANSEELPGYAQLYESHATTDSGTDVIGVGDFERIGQLELRFLQRAGLKGSMKVLDLGCGIGRLAQQLIPELNTGSYLGIDISPTMILRAEETLKNIGTSCHVNLRVGDGGLLNTIEPQTMDIACAFSVFTHMDLEDTYLHLQCIKRVLKPGSILVCSHLLLPESEDAKNIFNQSSVLPYQERRSRVISVVTSREIINSVAQMAGFQVNKWIAGSEELCSSEQTSLGVFGQAVCFLQVPK